LSFTLHLNDSGVYTKHDGAPLMPGQEILLANGVFELPQHFEEERGAVLVARQWRIPAQYGHYLVVEYLPVEARTWPW
jgi:hypothetical protein